MLEQIILLVVLLSQYVSYIAVFHKMLQNCTPLPSLQGMLGGHGPQFENHCSFWCHVFESKKTINWYENCESIARGNIVMPKWNTVFTSDKIMRSEDYRTAYQQAQRTHTRSGKQGWKWRKDTVW